MFLVIHLSCLQTTDFCLFQMLAGLRAVNTDWDPSDVASGQWDRTRLHVRHTQTPTDDHVRSREAVDSDVSQLTWPSIQHGGPTDVGYGLRGDGADVHVTRRGPESKADDVHGSHSAYPFALACSFFPSVVFAPVAARAWSLSRRRRWRPPFSCSFPSRSTGSSSRSRSFFQSIWPSCAFALCVSRVTLSGTQ